VRAAEAFRSASTPGAAPGGTARLWIDRAYLDGVEIQQITPEPDAVEAGPDRLIYVFRLNDPTQPSFVTINFQAVRIGRANGRVGLDGSLPVRFSQFVYP